MMYFIALIIGSVIGFTVFSLLVRNEVYYCETGCEMCEERNTCYIRTQGE